MSDRPTFDLLDPAFYQDGPGMHAAFAWMRANEPVYRDEKNGLVAVTRHAKRRDKDRAIAARRAAEAEALRPKRQADLARIEARLNAIDPFRRDDRGDGAVVNMPLAKRMPSDARISKLAHLHAERDRLRSLLGVRPA